jgi:hypothetical protein
MRHPVAPSPARPRHRRLTASLLPLTAACLFGCASPSSSGNPGAAGSNGSGTGGNGSPGTAGSGNPGTAGSGNPGTAGNGSSGTAGNGGGVACVPNPAQLINANAWNCDLSDPIAIQGAIYGYSDGSSCSVATGQNICTGSGGCCISGTTVLDPTFAKWGCGIGMELDSSGGTAPVKSVYAGTAKCFNITFTGSSGGNVVRVGFTQSANPPAGAVAPYTELAPISNGLTTQVCFTDAECPSWATAAQCSKTVGTAGTPIDMQIQVSAGSTATSVGPYSLCVSSIVPVTSTGGTGGTTSSCNPATGSGTINGQFDTAHVTCSGKDYIVQNNDWGVSSASQTLSYGPGTKMKVTTQNGTGAGSNPASYPSIFTGANANHTTTGSGLPRAVSAITAGSLSTSWTWAANNATGSYNAAYDVWFSTSASGEPAASSPTGGFLMVWFHKPTANQPIGAQVATATVGGKNWNVWYGNNSGNGKPCVSYVAQQSLNSLTFSLGDFIRDAVTNSHLQNSWYLTNVFAGFEIWNGGVGLETTDFAVTVP